MRRAGVVALVLALAAPALGQLSNGNFESGTTGWSAGLDISSLIHNPGTSPVGGEWGSVIQGDTAASKKVTQTVTASGKISLSGFWSAGENQPGSGHDFIVQIRDGGANGTLLAEVRERLVASDADAAFTWRPFQIVSANNATSGQVTVVFGFENGTGAFGFTGLHVDGLMLGTCTNVPMPTTITPNSGGFNSGNVNITITGTGLNNTNAVTLVKDGGLSIAATNVVASGTQVTATIPLSCAEGGPYHVMLTKATACSAGFIENGFTVDAPDVTVVQPMAQTGGIVNITLQGVNLQHVSQVRLRQQRTWLPNGHADFNHNTNNTGLQVNGDGTSLTATFDLTNFEAGRTDVIIFRAPCSGRQVIRDAILLYTPFNATLGANGKPVIFQNASFEEGYKADTGGPYCDPSFTGPNPKAKHWQPNRLPPFNLGGPKRDGDFYGPECAGNRAKNITGNHYNGFDISFTSDPRDVSFFQTVDIAPLLDNNNQLKEELIIQVDMSLNGGTPTEPITAILTLKDGSELETNPARVFTRTVQPDNHEDLGLVVDNDYTVRIPGGYQFQSNPPVLTFEVRMTHVGQGVNGAKALWVDNVRSIQGCRALFADVDGDGDVDQEDFSVWQICYTGSGNPIPLIPDYCRCFDRDRVDNVLTPDNDVDQVDFSAFNACASGPDVPADPDCVNY